MQRYDIAAYVWPSYTGDEPRTKIFWEEGIGEWQTVKRMQPRFYGHKWPRTPLWGYQNEADPLVMEMQIEEAVSHGVNVFIYDWYWYDRRPFLEQCLNNGFLKASNCNKMKFYLMWANHDATTLWDVRNSANCCDGNHVIWNGYQDFNEFKIIVKRIIENYFSKDNYYKIDGCPVFSVYDLSNLIKGFGGIEQTKAALDYFREQTVKAGFKGLNLQLVIHTDFNIDKQSKFSSGLTGLFKGPSEYLGFDSLTNYQMAAMRSPNKTYGRERDYLDLIEDTKWNFDHIDKNYTQDYFPHVSVGYDETPRFSKVRTPYIVNNTPENFKKALAAAKEYLDKHPDRQRLITVNSWNEWTEDSYLLPDDLNGYGYLQAIKEVFKDGEKQPVAI